MSIQRIQEAFTACGQRAALIPYISCGDPNAETTIALMHALVKAGADILELGIPFSDPMADGPVIQAAGERALAAGMTLKGVLQVVAEFRQQDQKTPVVLMGYANSIEAMGQAQFAQAAAQAGVDGVLVVDYPPEEYGDFKEMLQQADISPIFLLTPTSTDERIKQVAQLASGYLYYVSLKGVTGAATLNIEEVQQRVEHIKHYCNIPVGVGFGIRDAASAKSIATSADAVVIGSKLIQTLHQAVGDSAVTGVQHEAVAAAAAWLAEIRQGLETIR
ncbi:tryptophan synthase subunit alpha [Brackiella oedipodis]|uniref:tryptophan synthase subunit alpha n=1 Tax=Brackiella oedipodis TaxID=124225 RepID=UPI00048B444D|nr:tryptophan synthase subunit alpha [Brackiella oedipodis]